ncbi:hypothetical protein G5I_06269 [Acromyrmex echinatior]|uniref:Uncharacterized protein n=1 Tax=Acromyrmex echinatior TaxID=103372 RepID=F4WKK5_ACREC|nr:hypothetical protein G5I_06269 [Acromyrmex echinatior]
MPARKNHSKERIARTPAIVERAQALISDDPGQSLRVLIDVVKPWMETDVWKVVLDISDFFFWTGLISFLAIHKLGDSTQNRITLSAMRIRITLCSSAKLFEPISSLHELPYYEGRLKSFEPQHGITRQN